MYIQSIKIVFSQLVLFAKTQSLKKVFKREGLTYREYSASKKTKTIDINVNEAF